MSNSSEIIRLLRHIRLFCGIVAGVGVLAVAVLFFPEIVWWVRAAYFSTIGRAFDHAGPVVAVVAVMAGFAVAVVAVAMAIGRSATPASPPAAASANEGK